METKRIALVGHCGADSTYLRIAVRKAAPEADVFLIDDEQELAQALKDGTDLLLLNRELSYGFDDIMGVDMIKRLRPLHPQVKLMLVSNYAEAQADAIEAGALPGFGKRELGTPRVVQAIREALE